MQSLRLLLAVIFAAGLVPALAVPARALMPDVAAQAATCSIEGYPDESIQLMAPASPGGGWDTTSREMQRILQEEGIADTVEVYNVPGAGGTVGLAQFANDERGNDYQLMMMGLVMTGAIALNQSPATLDDVTPIARLTTEYEVIVVPDDSEFQTLDDLIAAFQDDPTAISWGGGSAGGTDHVLVGLLAEQVGVDPTLVNYVPFSGGGEALAAVLGGQVSAGVSGVGEWIDQIESGDLRALAVSGSGVASPGGTPVPAADAPATPTPSVAPTLMDQGIDLELANWRGVVAPPDISDESRQCLIAMIEEMRNSAAWEDTLANFGWQDFFLAGDEFDEYLVSERERVTDVLGNLGLI